MVQLADMYAEIVGYGASLLAVSPQTVQANEALAERRGLNFPILADDNQAVIREWGLFNSLDPKGRPIPYPAAYIVDSHGVIRWRNLGLAARERPTPGELLVALQAVALAEDAYDEDPANEGT